MIDNKFGNTFEEVCESALELAKEYKDKDHYYSKRNCSFVSLYKNEIDDYLANY